MPAARQNRSPTKVVAEISRLRPSKMPAPTSAASTPTPSCPDGARRAAMMPQAIRITLPELPNSVALASRVRSIPTCQLARSTAKNTPASRHSSTSRPSIGPGERPRQASSASTGSGSKSRQKPAETGPVSDSRTSHGPSASAMFPATSAAKCHALA